MGFEWLIQLNNVADRFGYGRRVKFFFDSVVIVSVNFSDLVSDPAIKEKTRLRRRALTAIWAKILALRPSRTLGLSRI